MKTPHEMAQELMKMPSAPTPPANTIPLETLVAEFESDPEMKAALDSARKDEPVAIVEEVGLHEGKTIFNGTGNVAPGQKLYARPADDKLRKAAEAFIKAYKPGWDHHGLDEYNELRAAMEGKRSYSETNQPRRIPYVAHRPKEKECLLSASVPNAARKG